MSVIYFAIALDFLVSEVRGGKNQHMQKAAAFNISDFVLKHIQEDKQKPMVSTKHFLIA
jgi:hypothetical protein